jgi:hypothetical protein
MRRETAEGCGIVVGTLIGVFLSVLLAAWVVQLVALHVFAYSVGFWTVVLVIYALRLVYNTIICHPSSTS